MEAIASKNQGKFAQSIRNRELKICKICGEPTQYLVNIPLMNKQFLAHINCRCEREKLEIQRENELKQEKLAKIAELKNLSLISKRYENVSFENTQIGHNASFEKAFERCKRYCENHQNNDSFDKAFEHCKRYCENHQKVYENGNGIYLFGAKGTGKTHGATRF